MIKPQETVRKKRKKDSAKPLQLRYYNIDRMILNKGERISE